jgi:hypothetical protein
VMTKEYTANCKNVETKIRVCKKMWPFFHITFFVL